MRVFWDVDTQVDFMSPEGKLYVPGAETIAPNLGRLTDYAHVLMLALRGVSYRRRYSPSVLLSVILDAAGR
jgi:hypothetical protein